MAEDMSYNKGPMLSKPMFDEFLAPYYHEIIPPMRDRGIIPVVDTDGNVMEMIPWLEEVGVQGTTPLERRAGNHDAAVAGRMDYSYYYEGARQALDLHAK